MAKYRVTSPDGQTYEVTAPEGASQADVMGYAQKNFAQGAAAFAPERPPDPAAGMNRFERTMVGLGRGASGVYQGVKQAGLQAGEALGMTDPGTANAYTQRVQAEHALYDRHKAGLGTAGQVGEFIGAATALPIPGVGAGAGLAGRLGGAAAMGGVQGAAEFVPEGNSRVQNALVGTLSGAGFQGIVGEPLRAGAKGVASLVKGGAPNLTGKATNALRYAQDRNLPIYYDDIAGSASARAMGTFSDDLPFVGTGSSRRNQAAAAGQAAEDLVGRFANGSTGRVAETLKDSAENQLSRARGIKNKLYGEAFQQLNAIGDFDLPATRAMARQIIAHNQKKGTLADQALIAELQRYADAPTFNFEGWHGTRSQLGGTIRDRMSGQNAVISDAGAAQLSTLKGRMDAEIAQVASKAGPASANAWKRADSFYRETIPKYKRGVVADLLRSKNPDAIADRILAGRDSGGIARQVYQALDRGGRAEVRSTLLQRALDKANVVTADGGDSFSPGIFARELERVENRTAAFFSKQDQKEIEGLRNYMTFVKQAGTYAANPPTGKRALPHMVLLAGSGALGANAVAAYGGTAAATRLLLRTESGRNLLLRMGSVSPQSKQAAETAQMINAYLQRASASTANQALEIDIVGGTPISQEQARQEYGR